ncbi:MAG: hypothetical protein AAGG48_15960 [Planctomycetota bacterium]
MRTNQHIFRFVVATACLLLLSAAAVAGAPEKPDAWMCTPGELLFSENFDPETVSDRWGFKADFALREGALLRTSVDPNETKRVFLKDASFRNAIIQFDFKLSGQTTDLRLVTGGDGIYNSITQIRPGHFQVNTPVDHKAGIVPAHLGECSRESSRDRWQTMTVEYWNDEMVAHLSTSEFVLGQHPIIDRTRGYFAFQFDLPGASIDNIRIWTADGQRESWFKTRKALTKDQANRSPVIRDPDARYRYEYTNLKSRLTLHDPVYRELVAKHKKLTAALHAGYPDAFVTHKQLSKRITKNRLHLRNTTPEFKSLESAVNKARRAEDEYAAATKPELAKLKADGVVRQLYVSELGQVRAQLEAAGDRQLASLVAETARRQAALEARFPVAFESVEAAVEKRQAIRNSLNDNAEFQARNRGVVEAYRAIKDYELQADPEMASLAAKSKTYIESLKTSEAERSHP